MYDELPYHVAYADERTLAINRLRGAGFDVVQTSLEAKAVDKARAIGFYASQVSSLEAGFDQAVAGPEVFHDLVRTTRALRGHPSAPIAPKH